MLTLGISQVNTDYTVTDLPGIGPTAIPKNTVTLGKFLALQRAVNAYIKKYPTRVSAKPLAVDGRLGPNTLRTYNLVIDFVKWIAPADDVASMGKHAEDMGATVASEVPSAWDASIPARMRPGGLTTTRRTTPLTVGQISPDRVNRKALWWIVGLLAVAGVAVFGVATYRRRRT